jgi:hypothetical protein
MQLVSSRTNLQISKKDDYSKTGNGPLKLHFINQKDSSFAVVCMSMSIVGEKNRIL